MIYQISYYLMLIGYGGLTLFSKSPKETILGVLLLIVNALIFYKG